MKHKSDMYEQCGLFNCYLAIVSYVVVVLTHKYGKVGAFDFLLIIP